MLVKKLDKIKSQIVELGGAMKDIESQIETWEKPIVDKWGWTSSQIIEMNGALPENEGVCATPECDVINVNE